MAATTYNLVLLSSMNKTDQTTYADYPEQFGRCSFTGQMGICKVVPTDGPTRVLPQAEQDINAQVNAVTQFLKDAGVTPASTTALQVAQAIFGRDSTENIRDPDVIETAAGEHPTPDDFDVTAGDAATAAAAALAANRS